MHTGSMAIGWRVLSLSIAAPLILAGCRHFADGNRQGREAAVPAKSAIERPLGMVYLGRCSIAIGTLNWSDLCWSEWTSVGLKIGWLPGHRFPAGISGFTIITRDGLVGSISMHLTTDGDRNLGLAARASNEPQCWENRPDKIKLCAAADRPMELEGV